MVANDESRKRAFIDIDRMVNEGLGGGQVTLDNGLIGDSTTDTIDDPESVKSESTENTQKGKGAKR